MSKKSVTKNKKTINDFIREHKYLIWWTKNWDGLNKESIVEATLNYGNWDDVQEVISILGMKKTAEIFVKTSTPDKFGRINYHAKTKHFFNLYFNKYANTPRDINHGTVRTPTSRSQVFAKF